MKKPALIVVLGATASGKTSLAIKLAKALRTEILSGDSMLVYKGFDVGTAKPTLREREGIQHHFIDICEPTTKFTVSEFQVRAQEMIQKLNAEGKIPILAGGTGLYIKSLLEGYQFNASGEDTSYRMELEELVKKRGKLFLHEILEEKDPETAARLHPNDVRRIIRALEVFKTEEMSISTARLHVGEQLCYNTYVIGLNWDRTVLYDRINQRVDKMMELGLENEVQKLQEKGILRTAPPMKGIGYKEILQFFDGNMNRIEAIAAIKKATRNFAKRQLTWYRKMPYIHWYSCVECGENELYEYILQDVTRYFYQGYH